MKLNSSQKAYYAILFVATIITILPVWIIKYPPLVDYPNHLARAYIISNYNNVDIFNKYLSFAKEPLPNIAFDVLVPLFNYITGNIYISGKLFITLSIVLIIYGCHKLAINLRGFTYIGFIGLFFSYNSGLLYGFMNYVFGLGMCLISIAMWIKNKYVLNIRNITILIIMSTLSYLSHLSSFVFLNVVIFTISAFDYLLEKNHKYKLINHMSGSFFTLLPGIMIMYFMQGTGTVGALVWNSFMGKIINIAGSMSLYSYKMDIIINIFILSIFISLIYLVKKRIVSFNINMPVFVAGIILWILFLIFPKGIFTGSAADARFIPIAAIMTIASIEINAIKHKNLLKILFSICFIIIIGTRLWQIEHYWGRISKNIEGQTQYFRLLKSESIVIPIVFLPQKFQDNKIDRALFHVIQYSTIDRHNICTTLAALRGQHSLNFRNNYDISSYQINENVDLNKIEWGSVFKVTNYIWTYAATNNIDNVLMEKCKILFNENKIKIYKTEE
jgi:hypothetical protein